MANLHRSNVPNCFDKRELPGIFQVVLYELCTPLLLVFLILFVLFVPFVICFLQGDFGSFGSVGTAQWKGLSGGSKRSG